MATLTRIAGIALVSVGAWIIVVYWTHWLRLVAMKLGWGSVKGMSMAPFVGPIAVALGATLFGEPLSGSIGWWILLVDTNTYVLAVSLPVLAWSRLRGGPA